MPRRLYLVAPAVLLLAGCGGGSGHDSGGPIPTSARPVPTTLPAPTPTAPASTPTTSTSPPPTTAPPLPPPPPTSTTSTAPTAPASSTGECGNVAGGFIKDLRAGGVPCSLARATARAWFAKVQEGADPSQQITAGAFACTGTLHGERASVRCRPTEGEGGSVTFEASP